MPLVLYHFEDLSYEEIAAQLDVSLAKVKTDIRRGRAALAPHAAAARNRRCRVSHEIDREESLDRDLEARLGQALRPLPPRRAPATLESRVLDALARRARRPGGGVASRSGRPRHGSRSA